jgi:uncharacterized protein YjbI with pentapeptide repeats
MIVPPALLGRAILNRSRASYAFLCLLLETANMRVDKRLEHLGLLRQGVDLWNAWRKKRPSVRPNLVGAIFAGTDLSHANLVGADLRYADLSRANLSNVNLSHANLSHVNLSHVNLSHVNLSHVNLSHVNLSHANLGEANLRKAKPDDFHRGKP